MSLQLAAASYIYIQGEHKFFPRLQTLQENYVEYKHFLPLPKSVSKILCHVFIVILQLHVCIPRSFLVINVFNQGKISCSPCILRFKEREKRGAMVTCHVARPLLLRP
jgi:hypothetical protein